MRQFFLQFANYRVLGLDLGYTVTETLLGFALGTVSGMLAAMVLFRSPPRGARSRRW